MMIAHYKKKMFSMVLFIFMIIVLVIFVMFTFVG